jgi:hypothetical protein
VHQWLINLQCLPDVKPFKDNRYQVYYGYDYFFDDPQQVESLEWGKGGFCIKKKIMDL